MNTNGTSSGDTWRRECRGWAVPVEQQREEGQEAAEMLQRGMPGDQHPKQHPWDAQTQKARDKGRPPPAAEGSSRRIRCAESAEGLRSPQHHLWP